MKVKASRVIGLVLARKSSSQTNRFRQPSVSTPKNRKANSPISMKLKKENNINFELKTY